MHAANTMTSPPHDPYLQDAHDYNFSGGIYDDGSDNAPTTDEDLLNLSTRHSSVSSFPSSVVHHAPATPTKTQYVRATTPTYSPRPHSTGFRHPSSVRALQMQDEYEFPDYEGSHHRRPSKLSSCRFSGSYHSSPTKSLRTRSARGSKMREYPLVLLHCTLLPPALSARAKLLQSSDKESLLEAIIPEPYVSRWRTLQEKVVKNGEVKQRGVLIPHPREEYELLEERLLESLELERPRIRDGHFLSSTEPGTANDSGFESGGTDSESLNGGDSYPLSKCPDCGHKVSNGAEQERKWEVKVFAANGLMKAGAWSAAWSDMEKVDVQVGIWMPEEIRREVDARLEALIAKDLQDTPKLDKTQRGLDDERAKEIYGQDKNPDIISARSQAEIDGFADVHDSVTTANMKPRTSPRSEQQTYRHSHRQPDVMTLLYNYIQLLTQDRRNIAILLLSVLVAFYGISGGKSHERGAVSNATDFVSGHRSLDAISTVKEIARAAVTSEAPPTVADGTSIISEPTTNYSDIMLPGEGAQPDLDSITASENRSQVNDDLQEAEITEVGEPQKFQISLEDSADTSANNVLIEELSLIDSDGLFVDSSEVEKSEVPDTSIQES